MQIPLSNSAAPNTFRLDELNEPQREAAAHRDGPLLVLAGAGSGKTRVITYRIANLLSCGVPAWNILAVTFTNKAAEQMRLRVAAMTQGRGVGVWISTFHSFCAQLLRVEGPSYGLDRNFTIYDDDDQKKIIRECLKELSLDEKKLSPSMVVSRISREKDQLMDAESYSISASLSQDPNKELLASIYSLYQKKLDRSSALDFGDLILKTVEFLMAHSPLKEKLQERFKYVLVDEYQDTNHAQYVLIKILAAKYKNICVVGDDDQSIYSWRGADIKNILEFEKDYEQVKVVKLEQNYRSTQFILDGAWKLVQHNLKRKDKKLWTARKSQDPIVVRTLANELEEADWIVSKVIESAENRNLAYNDFALFYRTNAQSRVLEDACRANRVPYRVVGTVRFYERAEVKDVLAYIKVVVNPKDNLSFKRMIHTPSRGIGKTTLEAMEKYGADKSLSLYEVIHQEEFLNFLGPKMRGNLAVLKKQMAQWIVQAQTDPVSKLLKQILSDTRILDLMKEEAKIDLEISGRLDNIQELMNATEEFEEKSKNKTASAYLEQVSLIAEYDATKDSNSTVTLMTVHIAKGLEFPVVFVTGLEEGLFPLGESQFDEEELAEERRLAYVAMTRAKDQLYLTASASRKLFGQTRWNLPSRFITEAGLTIPSLITENSFSSYVQEEPSGLFRIGERVCHSGFGFGSIIRKSGSGEEEKVVVQFDDGTWRKLLVKYAGLKKA